MNIEESTITSFCSYLEWKSDNLFSMIQNWNEEEFFDLYRYIFTSKELWSLLFHHVMAHFFMPSFSSTHLSLSSILDSYPWCFLLRFLCFSSIKWGRWRIMRRCERMSEGGRERKKKWLSNQEKSFKKMTGERERENKMMAERCLEERERENPRGDPKKSIFNHGTRSPLNCIGSDDWKEDAPANFSLYHLSTSPVIFLSLSLSYFILL